MSDEPPLVYRGNLSSLNISVMNSSIAGLLKQIPFNVK